MPAQIGPNQYGTLRCKVDTGAGGNVMPLHVFAKLFPKDISTDIQPLCLHPSNKHLTAYNRSTIPQLGALDTTIESKSMGHHLPSWLHTWWYVADNPAMLGLPSSSNFGIVQLNCAVQLAHRCRTLPPLLGNLQQKEWSEWHDTPPESIVPITETHTEGINSYCSLHSPHGKT